MRSETKVPAGEMIVRLNYVSAIELERSARAYRARVIGELLADAIVWVSRLPRRLVEAIEMGGRRQGV